MYAFVPFGVPLHHGTLIKDVYGTYTCVLRTGFTIVADVDDEHNPIYFEKRAGVLKNTKIKTNVTDAEAARGHGTLIIINNRLHLVSGYDCFGRPKLHVVPQQMVKKKL